MNTVAEILLHAERQPDGQFLFVGTNQQGERIPPEELAAVLFAWDEPSYYGTFLATAEAGLLLSPSEALRFWTDSVRLEYVTYRESAACAAMRSTAQLIRQALASGDFLPNLSDWKKGHEGWRLSDASKAAFPPGELPAYADAWLSETIADMLEQSQEVRQAWKSLQQHYPGLHVMGDDLSPHLQEPEWLRTIGWLPDLCPFRTCLQLVEAHHGADDWFLQVSLQDREQPERLYVLEAGLLHDTELATAAIPHSWRTYWGRFLHDLQTCEEILPWLSTQERHPVYLARLTNEQAWSFLTTGSLQLVQSGIHVFLPVWWEQAKRAKPRLIAKVGTSVRGSRQSFIGISQLMEFEWKLAVGDVQLGEAEFQQLLEQKKRLLQINGQWIQLTPDLLWQVQEAIKKSRGKQGVSLLDLIKMNRSTIIEADDEGFEEDDMPPLSIELEMGKQLQELFHQLAETKHIPMLPQPEALKGTLRRYQQEGSSWLFFMRRYGLGACLADDMGLGKTVQFITYLLHLKQQGNTSTPSLLICPTSVIGNWQKELERFAPSLRVHIHYGGTRPRKEDFVQAVKDVDVVITTYTLTHLDEAELSSLTWATLCLDEAQNIKNPSTKQATAVRQLQALHRIAMTGTPIENRLSELWSIFDFLNPGYLGSLREFTVQYVLPVERDNQQQLVKQVQQLIQPFLLRRVKTDPSIQLDLPEKLEQKVYVPLTAEQGALYETTIQNMFSRLEDSSPMARRGLILTTLTRLKQLCDHPALIQKDFSQANDASRSHKLERVLELIGEIRQKGERCLIFTQYIEMGHLLQHILEREGYGPVLFLHGSTPKEKRDEMIARFQDPTLPDESRGAVFILSLRAGGTGLTLTEANHVIHIDRWWNPAVENQATDRVYRIGQERNVQVYKFIALGTIEERIDEMMERKTSLSQQIVGSSEKWITELSASELQELFKLRHDWVNAKE
ncbi:DEAD/DEAH box helicase [Brevibacillus sp. TJ4]|uniref:DEAD/DEAH box helicase n=1 Tax=Brevibacillus sp. TJ4 TaxID=3234853 RepID=UPI0037D8E8FD